MTDLSFSEKVGLAIDNPRLVLRKINRISHNMYPGWDYENNGVDFMDEDWDNLLILDACRYDIFAQENSIPGTLERRLSKASTTVEFLRTNIHKKDLSDTVYVTANGQIQNHRDEIDANFHDIIPLYFEEWDDDLGTVPPQRVTERAIKVGERYPNKRLLVHYVQPHFPFIGDDTEADKHRKSESEYEYPFWQRVFNGETELSEDDIWEAYRKTLVMALPHVERAVESLFGKSVVTSDHGNVIGERAIPIPIREYGHPAALYHPKLVEVPWLVCENGNRKQIVSEPSRGSSSLRPDPTVVTDRLEDLGYK